MADRYPSFALLFRPMRDSVGVSVCLKLLNLGGREAEDAVAAVRMAMQQSADLDAELLALLDEVDWRAHLPAAVAIGLGYADSRVVEALWRAFDRGSWVSPQLAAAAFLADPHFQARARQRIEMRCSVDVARLVALDPLLHHHVAGPAGGRERSAKALSALIALCGLTPSWSTWLEPLRAASDTEQMLACDQDRGNQIAERWLRRLSDLAKVQ